MVGAPPFPWEAAPAADFRCSCGAVPERVRSAAGAATPFSRRVERASPGLGPSVRIAEPPGWGWRGAVVGGAFAPDAVWLTVTLVCPETWLLLCTVPPPTVWDVLLVERADWVCAAVSAAPDWTPLGCLVCAVLGAVPAVPGRGAGPLDVPGLDAGAVPAAPERGLLAVWEAPAPAVPGADGALAVPEGGT